MAPRERSKKRGNLRIDAALDAMNPFGFHPKLVRDTVKELLSVCFSDFISVLHGSCFCFVFVCVSSVGLSVFLS